MTGHIGRMTTVDVTEHHRTDMPAAEAHRQRVDRLREAGTPYKVDGLIVTWDEVHDWGTRRTAIEYRDANQDPFDFGALA